MNWEKYEKENPINLNYAYFDTGAAAPPAKRVVESVQQYLKKTAEVGIYLPSFRKETYEQIEQTRKKLADFLNSDPEEVAFTNNGTESICLVAQGIDFQPGDEVIIPDTEMISNLSIWYQLESTKGIKVVRVKANKEQLLEPSTIESAITERTKLISFVALSNVTGAVQPIKEICALSRRHNVLTHINASQAIGMMDLNVREIGCDFMSACGRKGLRAIEGSGILYVNSKHIKKMTSCLIGWWNSSYSNGKLTTPETAKKFEVGCPNTPAIIALDVGLDLASEIGIENISRRVRELTDLIIRRLSRIPGFEYYGPKTIENRLGLVPFNIKGIDSNELTKHLETKKVIIESGHFMAGAILEEFNIERMGRISLHYFNNEEQIETMCTEIETFLESGDE